MIQQSVLEITPTVLDGEDLHGSHSHEVIIVGAGLAGLGAAATLARYGAAFRIVEAEDCPGGLMRTDTLDGFHFDRAGHFLHFRTAEFQKAVSASGVPMVEVARRSAVILDDAIVPYPLQFNLWAAPAALRQAALAEISELAEAPALPGQDFDAALSAVWGKALMEAFFRPYNEKMWSRPLSTLPCDCGGRFLPTLDLALLRSGAKKPISDYGYNACFQYPQSGRIGDLADRLAAPHGGRIGYGLRAGEIDLAGRRRRVNGRWIGYSQAIMTDPLPLVLAAAGIELPENLCFDACDVLNLRVGFEGAMESEDHWHYVPDPNVPFFRVGYPANVVSNSCPTGCASLSLELCAEVPEALLDPETLARTALDYLAGKGVLRWRAIRTVGIHRIAPAYAAYRRTGRPEFEPVFEALAAGGIIMAGRYGEWEYLSAEDAWLSGARAAERALAGAVT